MFNIGFLKSWASIISLGDSIWSNIIGGDGLINLIKSIYPLIRAGLVGIIKFFIINHSPSLVGIGIKSFILFILNLYMAFEVDILIKVNFI